MTQSLEDARDAAKAARARLRASLDATLLELQPDALVSMASQAASATTRETLRSTGDAVARKIGPIALFMMGLAIVTFGQHILRPKRRKRETEHERTG